MSIDFLKDYFAPVVVGLCLCVGYIVKKWTPADNKFIPTICAALGVVLNLWANSWTVTPGTVLTGMFSGLASTGLYEALRGIIEKKE